MTSGGFFNGKGLPYFCGSPSERNIVYVKRLILILAIIENQYGAANRFTLLLLRP